MAERESLEHFVRHTLGCRCPDEVFRRIEDDRQASAGPIPLSHRIDVGRRLLVYVLRSDDAQWLRANLATVFEHGGQERDREGFNRLRVVIATSDPDAVTTGTSGLFDALEARDDRMHLHVVRKDMAAL